VRSLGSHFGAQSAETAERFLSETLLDAQAL
jgi:hypothetical protein